MATEPISPQTGNFLDDILLRFDVLIDQLANQPEEAQPEEAQPVELVALVAPVAPVGPRPEAAPESGLAGVPTELTGEIVLSVTGLVKSFGATVAVDHVNLSVQAGTIFGIVGPNGAGKTTTLSMITGLLRPDAGEIRLGGADVWTDSAAAKSIMGILPDRLLLFDRLTGRQLLFYSGMLRGLDAATAKRRTADLVASFDIEDAQDRLVTDYSAGMAKKIALACAMIHAPRVLILDEPFESVDSVSADRIIKILNTFVDAGGTVVLSSHSMDLIERICDHVAVFVDGKILSAGTTAAVRGDQSLEERFVDLVSASNAGEDLEWLRSFSD